MFDQLKYDDFNELLNTEFEIEETDENIRLKLFEISENKQTPPTECFSLFLKGQNSAILEQRTYNFKHEKCGEGELFIVPIRQENDGVVYESVFNRYIKD